MLRDTYQLELADLSLEVGDFPKIFIYNSKSHKSNLIYALEVGHDLFRDVLAVDLKDVFVAELVYDFSDHEIDLLGVYLCLFSCLDDRVSELFDGKILARPIRLAHWKLLTLNGFDRRKAMLTLGVEAFAATLDREIVFSGPRIDHLVVFTSATGAAHSGEMLVLETGIRLSKNSPACACRSQSRKILDEIARHTQETRDVARPLRCRLRSPQ